MEAIVARELGLITFEEFISELERLDNIFQTLIADWHANVSNVVPIMQEDLICENHMVLNENQYN